MTDQAGLSGKPITIRGVSKTFGEDGDKPFRALKQVDIDIRPASSCRLLAPRAAARAR